MTDYIEREAFLLQCRRIYCEDCERRKGMKNGKKKTVYAIGDAPCKACLVDDIMGDIEDFPAADVRPVVHGRWIVEDYGAGDMSYECSECKDISCCRADFCPDCGADMREG